MSTRAFGRLLVGVSVFCHCLPGRSCGVWYGFVAWHSVACMLNSCAGLRTGSIVSVKASHGLVRGGACDPEQVNETSVTPKTTD